MTEQQISEWNRILGKASPEETITFFHGVFGNRLCQSSSMGVEDQVLTDILVKTMIDIRIVTLDTGRLFPETLNLIAETDRHYGIRIEVFFPDHRNVEKMVMERGINLFYDSIENRKLCCSLRKIEPLKRALNGMEAWITGIRKDQTLERFHTRVVEWDEGFNLIKINPLYRWTETMVWDYIRKNKVPYNQLYDRGYRSLGCQPCTRPVKTGEDPRSGRWWWEDQGHKECGLHVRKDHVAENHN
ncbi:MAG: phosphoadenylyl-sulfate reductase [Bacteroidales bacterium]|nr:phosphoadenylyl-sulfate reductase [Bacteroidales bacterium]